MHLNKPLFLLLAPLLLAIPLTAQTRSVVINELMYHPPDDRDDLQYIELHNPGTNVVDLSGWSFSKGVEFTFPPRTTLAAGGFLVVTRSNTAFAPFYGRQIPAVGNFKGKLSHSEETVELVDASKAVVDRVKYADKGEWPMSPDGYSSSLERIHPKSSGDSPHHWASSAMPSVQRSSGTPGKRNDSWQANNPPAVRAVTFPNVVTNAARPVPVTAEVGDPDGVKSVSLLYRTVVGRTEGPEKEIAMTRASGDPSNGTYRAELPAGSLGEAVRFRIKAADGAGSIRLAPGTNEVRPSWSVLRLANTNTSRIANGFSFQTASDGKNQQRVNRYQTGSVPSPTRGNGYFVYLPPESAEVLFFDHVQITPRNSGAKVHFLKDQPLRGMTTINVLFESMPRHVLAEHLAYEVFRRADVLTPHSEHIRVSHDGRMLGYHLLVEQPNKAFLSRHGRDPDGNLYKLLWYGDSVIDKHEKKTNDRGGHQDLLQLINGLDSKRNADQWAFIQSQFKVHEMASYYAVNMCLQNWDGFFNNYFAYHDLKKDGKWELIPWDEDKTWGDYDGASRKYNWYEMPLSFGMNGDRSPRDLTGRLGHGPFGGVSWWRPAGFFSGPLLANPEFRKVFLKRTQELCDTVFTEAKLWPMITSLERKLEPEVRLRATSHGLNAEAELRTFAEHMESFRLQVQNRRKFLLAELAKER